MLEDNPARTFLEDESVLEYSFNLFIREWYFYAKLDMNNSLVEQVLGTELYQSVKAVKVSRKKWRKSLWSKIQATAMDDKERKKAHRKSPYADYGYIMGGLFSTALYLLSQLSDDDFRQAFDIKENELEEFRRDLDELQNTIITNETKEKDLLNEYYFKGKGRYSGGGFLFEATKATTRHYIMLMLGPRLEEMRSVNRMYHHLSDLMGDDFGMTWPSFKDFCKVIGLQGKRGKRLRSK